MYSYHYQRPGFKVAPGSSTYLKDISTHKYCLAPTGGGHGKRNILTSLMGCVPVTITDHVLQPFEPELRWEDWSVHVAEKDIPHLHDILAAVPPERLAEMQVSKAGEVHKQPYAHACRGLRAGACGGLQPTCL